MTRTGSYCLMIQGKWDGLTGMNSGKDPMLVHS